MKRRFKCSLDGQKQSNHALRESPFASNTTARLGATDRERPEAAMTDVATYSPTSVILRIDKENPVSSSIAGKHGGIEKSKNSDEVYSSERNMLLA
jgi:hypothetical protein